MPTAWQFQWDGHTYSEWDVVVSQWAQFEADLSVPYFAINPQARITHARVVVPILVAAQTGTPRDEVLAKFDAMTTRDILAMFTEAEDDLPVEYADGLPLTGGEPSTSGSSGAPDDSAGPLT